MKWVYLYIVCSFFCFTTKNSYAQNLNDTATIEQVVSADSVSKETDEEDPEDEKSSEPKRSKLRSVSENKWDSIKKDKAFVYTKVKKKPEEHTPKTHSMPVFKGIAAFFNASLFKGIMFLLVAALLLLVIYHLFLNGDNNFFVKRKKKSKSTDSTFENVEIFSAWDKALKEALATNNYRLATRVLYLETLQKLNQQGWIKFEQEKTNWDYVAQLSASNQADQFTTLTKYFDYIWYGSFIIDHTKYDSIEQLFRHFQLEIK